MLVMREDNHLPLAAGGGQQSEGGCGPRFIEAGEEIIADERQRLIGPPLQQRPGAAPGTADRASLRSNP
ncbi:hypothetical protein V1282_004421 [Nitrobacteraceae bacterium AZCC 2146]